MISATQSLTPEPRPLAARALPRRRHVLDLDDFAADEISLVLDTADGMREILARDIRKTPALRGTTVVNLFYEPSTRTRVSFEIAARNLSADVVNISATGSSVEKGETLVDTVHTVRALGADIVVLRHKEAGAPYLVAELGGASVINAGDGWHAHPTQALLDLYTIRARCGRVAGLKAVIVGDILHSRVARSNVWGLTALGAHVVLCGPPTLLPAEFASGRGNALLPRVEIECDADRALADADVVMALRIQHERQESGLLPSLREYVRFYQVNAERLRRARPDALVMHPGPMNEGIEISHDVAHGAQSVIRDQVTSGVAIRMAILYLLAGPGPRVPSGES